MDTSGIDRMLSQLRTAQALASRKPVAPSAAAETTEAAGAAKGGNFADALKSSLDGVNKMQNEAVQLQKNFTVGDPNTNLQDVMISMQKANIAFQQAVSVRNKLVQAYHDVMNMQV